MPKSTGVENWDDVEVFTSKGAKLKDARIAITENCAFVLNAGFCHRADITEKSHVVVSYSPQNKAIIFQFTSDGNAIGALKLMQRSGGASFGSRSFFSYYFLDPNQSAGRYEPVKKKIPKIGEAWVINLDEKQPESVQQPQQ
ncbi:MAG: hypothetical protein PHN78_07575 [Dehalococcoidales bacterium]|nr:hypothetical protein [Dehalococcoidales bacterium]